MTMVRTAAQCVFLFLFQHLHVPLEGTDSAAVLSDFFGINVVGHLGGLFFGDDKRPVAQMIALGNSTRVNDMMVVQGGSCHSLSRRDTEVQNSREGSIARDRAVSVVSNHHVHRSF